MKRIGYFRTLAICAALALGACQITQSDPGSPAVPAVLNPDGTVKTPAVSAVAPSETKVLVDPLTAISDWVHQDGAPTVIAALKAVSVNAAANGDSTAQQCWDGAQPVVTMIDQTLQGMAQGFGALPADNAIAVALWAVQLKRNLKGNTVAIAGQVRQQSVALHNACDALANDEIKGKFDLGSFFSGQAKLTSPAAK